MRQVIISIVQPKGGVCKSTLAQTLASSTPFAKRFNSIGIVEMGPHGILASIFAKRKAEKLKNGRVRFLQVLSDDPDAIRKISDEMDAVVIDLPSHSTFPKTTGFIMERSDILLVPNRNSAHDEQILEERLWPIINFEREKGWKGTVLVLPVLVLADARPDTHANQLPKTVPPFATVMKCALPHRPDVFEHFNRGGRTLSEYAAMLSGDPIQQEAAHRAIADIESIAKELLMHDVVTTHAPNNRNKGGRKPNVSYERRCKVFAKVPTELFKRLKVATFKETQFENPRYVDQSHIVEAAIREWLERHDA